VSTIKISSLLHSPVTSSILGPNIHLSTLAYIVRKLSPCFVAVERHTIADRRHSGLSARYPAVNNAILVYIANISKIHNAVHRSELQDGWTKGEIITWQYFSMDSRSGKTSSLNVALEFLARGKKKILREFANANSRSEIFVLR